jgi:hypothetical protein
MSRYSNNDTDWLMAAARRNPEAVLRLAAACCLLLRSGSPFAFERSEYDDDVRGTSPLRGKIRRTHDERATGCHAPRLMLPCRVNWVCRRQRAEPSEPKDDRLPADRGATRARS